MSAPRTRFVGYLLDGAFRRLAVHEWGEAGRPAVVCVHGLARNGRDFDVLAEALADRYHVLCPDLPGRGASDWLDGAAQYTPLSYVQALSHLLATLAGPVRWVGTSLGGICGMLVCAARNPPVSHLVLNDIGPYVAPAALQRIAEYLGKTGPFPTIRALELHLRVIYAPFGPLSDAQWAHLARHSARALPEGGFAMHYDPAIAVPPPTMPPPAIDLWPVWQAIRTPTLVIRGAQSDILSGETLERMRQGGARAFVVPDAGHAPALMAPDQIAAIGDFLA